MRKFQRKDFINKTFGSRQCIGFRRPSKANKNTSQLTLLCECGNITTQSVWTALHYPHCKSCGHRKAYQSKKEQFAALQAVQPMQDMPSMEPTEPMNSPEPMEPTPEQQSPETPEAPEGYFLQLNEPTKLEQLPTHDLQVLLLAKLRADNSMMRAELTKSNIPQDLTIANLRSENAQLALTATLQEIYLKFELPKSARINENGSISYEP